jgi:hypothetical protein
MKDIFEVTKVEKNSISGMYAIEMKGVESFDGDGNAIYNGKIINHEYPKPLHTGDLLNIGMA